MRNQIIRHNSSGNDVGGTVERSGDLACLAPPRRPRIGAAVAVGMLTLVVGCGGFVGWAMTAPLASAVVTPGTIVVDTSRKTIQHVEGGTVAELLVREGDRVEAGQVLVRLDDLEAKGQNDLLVQRELSLAAREARLLAERDNRPRIVFPPNLIARGDAATEVIAGQTRIFESSRVSLDGQIGVLRQRVAQVEAQATAIDAQLRASNEQLPLIEDELSSVKSMFARGLERKPRLLALMRNASKIRGEIGEYQNRIAQLREAKAGAELEIINVTTARVEKANVELREVQEALSETRQRVAETGAKLRRRDVVATQPGTVLDLQYRNIGAVVPPGGKILDIVPTAEHLVVEARIKPVDIDSVRPGLPATVALLAFKSRVTPRVDARVVHVSADALKDERTGQQAFLAKLELDAHQLASLPAVQLVPGMPAEGFIEIGDRTLLAYLVQPLTDSFRRAFRER